jgi:hypothetical protein
MTQKEAAVNSVKNNTIRSKADIASAQQSETTS